MAMPRTSLPISGLVHPLPELALIHFLDVLKYVPSSLAEPFVLDKLRRCGVLATSRDVRNVLYKLRAAGLCEAFAEKKPCRVLKELQVGCPDSPTIYIGEPRSHCTCNRLLTEGQEYESFAQQLPEGMNYEPTVSPTRFRVFTLYAGLQFAVFRPKYCSECKKHYIGGAIFGNVRILCFRDLARIIWFLCLFPYVCLEHNSTVLTQVFVFGMMRFMFCECP